MRTSEDIKLPMHGRSEQEIGIGITPRVVLCHVPFVPAVVEHHNCSASGFEFRQVLFLLCIELFLELLDFILHVVAQIDEDVQVYVS